MVDDRIRNNLKHIVETTWAQWHGPSSAVESKSALPRRPVVAMLKARPQSPTRGSDSAASPRPKGVAQMARRSTAR